MRLFKGNRAFSGGARNDAARFDAATEFATYKAAVLAAGGTVFSDSATQEFIADLISCNVYSDAKLAITGAGGVKNMGASGAKAYSVGPTFHANDSDNPAAGFTGFSSGFYAKPAITFAVQGSYLEWAALPITDGKRLSILQMNPTTVNGIGQGTQVILDDGVNWFIYNSGAVSGEALAPYPTRAGNEYTMGPEYNTNSHTPFLSSWHLELPTERLLHTVNGNTTEGTYSKGSQTVTETMTKLWHDQTMPADADSFRVRLQGNTADQAICDFVILAGDHSWDDALAFAALRKARFAA